jgi:hypothetical protein
MESSHYVGHRKCQNSKKYAKKKNQQKISQNWPKLAISVTKRLIEDMEPSLLQLVDIGQNQGVISTISVSDC